MVSLTQLTLLLTLAAAIAHQKVGRHEESTERVLLTSRGAAVIERHSTQKDPDGGSGGEGGDDAGQTGGDQPDVTKAKSSESYVQAVTSSTPTGYIKMGTPEKWLKIIFDTGSDVLIAKTWLTVKAEMSTVDQGVTGDYMPTGMIFNSEASSTYVKHMHNNSKGKMVQLREEINYGSGPAALLNGYDTVKVGHFELQNFSISEIMEDRLPMLHKGDNISGVLGLQHMKNRSMGTSLFTKMRDQKQFTAFGYCRGTGDNGTFIWGDRSTEGAEVDVVGQIHWAAKLGKMTVKTSATTNSSHKHPPLEKHHRHHDIITVLQRDAQTDDGSNDESGPDDTEDKGKDKEKNQDEDKDKDAGEEKPGDDKKSDLAKDICKNSSCIGILDTGSNILAGPHDVMSKLTKELNVDPACKNFDSLPDITFRLGSQDVTVTPKGYVMKVPYPKGGLDLGYEESSGEASLRQGAKVGWKETFQNLHKTRGIDLSPAYGHLDLDKQLDDTSSGNESAKPAEFMCMPAFVTMDKKTKMGPLYIVGTPLFQTNYFRWSWAEKDESPKMFIKPLKDSATCGNAKVSWVGQESKTSLMRTDRFENTPGFDGLGHSTGPLIRHIEDIRYPHWATLLEDGADI